MIHIKLGQFLPDANGKPIFDDYDFDYVPHRTVLEYIELTADQIDFAVHEGKVYRGQDLWFIPLRDGDTIHLLPSLEGKNAALILGIVGAVVGYYFGGPAGSAAAFQWAMTGFAIGSTIGALITPHPKVTKSGDGALTSHQWEGINNEDRPGVPVPIPFGWIKTGGVRIGSFTRRNGTLDEELHLLLLVGRGPVEDIADIRINDQPYTNYANTTVETRLGTTGQTVCTGFNAIVNTYGQNVDLTGLGAGISYTYTTFRGDCDAFEVLFTLPGLSHTKSDGSLRQNTTSYRLEYQRVGSGTWINPDASTGNKRDLTASTRSTMFETRRIESLTPGQYNIRVTWLSATNTDSTLDLWHIALTGITEEKQDSRTYEGYALVAVRAMATDQLQGSIPTITCMVKGLKVPTWNGVSFDPATWGGTDPTNRPPGRNPAWLVLELLRNPIWGLGNSLTDANIDLPSFKAWADYCNEMVTVTPAGGAPTYQEARHQLDIVLNQQSKSLDVLQQLCTIGRACLVLSGNKFKIVIDKPGVPVQLFTMGNIRRGSFAYQTRREADRTNAYDVVINDRTREFDTSPFRVLSKQKVTIEGDPVRPQTLNLPGITRKSHAVRETTYRLNALLYLSRQIAFEASTDAILCEAGDIINFSHDVPQWGYSGRTMPISEHEDAHIVYVDQYLTIDATKDYEITVRPDDGSHEAGYTARVYGADQPYGTGQYNFVKLRDPLPFAVTDGMLYAFGPYTISVKPFRIISITRSDSGFRKIEAIEYNDSVANDADEIVVTTYTDLPNWGGPPAPITDGKAYEEISQRKDDRWVSTVIVQWTKPLPSRQYGPYVGAKVQRSWNFNPANPAAATWEDWAYTDGTEQRWYDAPHGVLIAFKVIPKAANGRYNFNGALVCYLTTAGYSVAPPAVSGFFAEVLDNSFVWTWQEQAKAVQYELRNANSGWGDNDPTKLVWRGRAQRFVLNSPTQRSITLFIKAIDANGNVSIGAVSATCTDAAPAAPAIGPVERYKNALKVKVTPPAPTADYVAIHLHASKQAGFTPTVNPGTVRNVTSITRSGLTVTVTTSAAHGIANGDPVKITGATQAEYNGTFRCTVTGTTTFTYTLDQSAAPATPATGTITAQAQPNRVAAVVGPLGGEFVFQISESGNWYFRASIEDWMTEKLGDWNYSAELAATLALIVPAAPFAVQIEEDTTDDGDPGRGLTTVDGTVFKPVRLQRHSVVWGFTENPANPPGALLGFQVILYSTDPNHPLYDAGISANPAMRSQRFTDYQIKNATTVIAAVKAIYADSITSPYVTSTGLTLDPGDDPPLSTGAYVDQRMGDIDLPIDCWDYFTFAKGARGARGTDPLTSFNTTYDLNDYGVVVEQFTFPFLTTHDMSLWTKSGCTVTKVTDGSVKPPVRGTWDVFKVTVTASTGAHNISRQEAVGNWIGAPWNSSFWVLQNRVPSAVANASVTDGVSGFASPSQNVTCLPGVWTRVQSGAVSSWPNGNTNRIAWLIIQTGQMSPGDVYYVAVPQLTETYYAHQPVPVSGFRNTGGIRYPAGPMSGDNWTFMVRFHRQPQSIPRYSTSNGYIFELRGGTSNPNSFMRLFQDFSQARLYIDMNDGTGTLASASALLPVSGYEENVVAVVRAGLTFKVFLNDGLLIPAFNATHTPTQTGAYNLLTLGAEQSGTDNYAFNGAFRNMAIFATALSDAQVMAYLSQGIRFVTSDARIVVPKPTSVTLTEV